MNIGYKCILLLTAVMITTVDLPAAQEKTSDQYTYRSAELLSAMLSAQEESIETYSFEFNNTPLEKALQEVARQSGLKILTNSSLIPENLRVSGQYQNLNVAQAFSQLLGNTSLDFLYSGNGYIIIIQKIEEEKEFQQTIGGTVTDSQTGEALPGVNILIQGTSTGTSTGADGEFELDVPSLNETLIITYIGFQRLEIPINGRTELEISLTPDIIAGDELVVVGYGVQRRSDITGSVSSVQLEDVEFKSTPSLEGALQGQASGVFVRQSGGKLDGDFEVSIRGAGTVTGDATPLYVVDGVPLLSGNLSTINQNDIESIEVLKDASATAIYGARAANGVVLITTKSGTPGAPTLTFSSNLGFEKITKTLDQLNTEQQRQLFVEAFKNSGLPTDVFDDPSLPFWDVDNNWQELITRTALRQEHNISLAGGDQKTTYSISGTFLDREGVLLNTDISRYSFRGNLNHRFGDRLQVNARLSGSQQEQNIADDQSGSYFGGSGTLRQAIFSHSYAPYKDEEGNFIGPDSGPPFFGNNTNPVARRLEETRENNSTRVLANLKLDFDISENLTLTGSGGADILRGSSYSFLPTFRRGTNQRTEGVVNEGNNREVNAVGDVTLRYFNTIAERHNLEGLIGVSAQSFEMNQNSINASGTQINLLDQVTSVRTFLGLT